jgi:integrase
LKRWSGVKKRFHDTRHTFASRKATSGWSITEIAAQGGWKQLQVLKRYTHIKAEYLAKKMV